MPQPNKTRAFWPDLLRATASFAVVMIHVHSWSFDKLSPNDQRGFLLIDTICYWSVPIFVMLSGALLLSTDQTRSYESPGTFLKKRWRRMIRPTIVWGIIALIWGSLALGRNRDETFRRMMTGIPNDPQWFLFMLLGLYALTPWLRMLLGSPGFQRTHLLGLISLLYGANLFALIQQMAGYSTEAISPINSLTYLDLYLLGVIVADPNALSLRTNRMVYFLAFLSTIIPISLLVVNPDNFSGFRLLQTCYHSPLVLIKSVAIFRFMVCNSWEIDESVIGMRRVARNAIRQLSDWSFGIYVIHPFVLSLLFKFVLRPVDGPFLFYCVATWILTMLITCLGCKLLRWRPITAWLIP
jgi:surface polysaccharide O-acyltransferase-like enzyme